MESSPALPSSGAGGASCWSAVLQKAAPPTSEGPIPSRVFGSCTSSKGVSVAVVDANAIVHGDKLASTADRFFSVREVLDEVRDPVSRQRLSFLPFPIETMEPSPDSMKRVVKFARETGDLQTLSDVDIKLIALTYMLEAQIHGTIHLRSCPPPLQIVNVKNLPESEMPGWGSNVPNLAEWEALEEAEEDDSNNASRILPLKDLNLNVAPVNGDASRPDEQEGEDQSCHKPKRFSHPKKEVKIDGKRMIASGVDASQGEGGGNVDDWQPAVSRSTHRRYLRRQARREMLEASMIDNHEEAVANKAGTTVEDVVALSDGESDSLMAGVHQSSGSAQSVETTTARECDLSTALGHIALKDEDLDTSFAAISDNNLVVDGSLNDIRSTDVENEHEPGGVVFEGIEISNETDRSSDTHLDGSTSDQSCPLQSISDSSVACVTSDFSMQNVILQMGLRLLAPGGMQIRQLHRWVLKCHACNKVTTEIGRIFCPKCGNGGTMRKVSVTVAENGLILASRRPRINLRGTKFSIPLPEGGRDAVTKNFVLREDQLPHKYLYPKQKKKNKSQDDMLGGDDIFSHASAKRAPLKPPVGKAVLVFTGKKNLNDNHFSRKH
ncbi:hypothetical protein Taro_030668 [Colocasia esculenta]|uniref:Uncharacterized protein n=1 Tax=Colocasia esculenta TaxID=4460 RepID=A0A843W0X0_COLES|nr:hypothetical protein [Colocasia esculenta]